jgi:hypothetical protein
MNTLRSDRLPAGLAALSLFGAAACGVDIEDAPFTPTRDTTRDYKDLGVVNCDAPPSSLFELAHPQAFRVENAEGRMLYVKLLGRGSTVAAALELEPPERFFDEPKPGTPTAIDMLPGVVVTISHESETADPDAPVWRVDTACQAS